MFSFLSRPRQTTILGWHTNNALELCCLLPFPGLELGSLLKSPCLFTPSHLLPHTPPFTFPLELLLFVQKQILLSRLISIRYARIDCLQAYRCATYTQHSPKSEEGFRCPGTGGTDSCKPTCGHQETNSHPLQVFSIAELSLHPQIALLKPKSSIKVMVKINLRTNIL